MNILVINGDCIQFNSSANLCHLAYIRGLVALGHTVSLLSADGRDYECDPSMKVPDEVKQYSYYAVSLYEKMSIRKRKRPSINETAVTAIKSEGEHVKRRTSILTKGKKFVLNLYGAHGIYSTFARKAKCYKSNELYDYVISLSTPPSSHLLAFNLLRTGHVHAKHWIQIWEDPWYSDAYGFNGKERIYKEEKRLLSYAEKVCYVSPLTLKNQQSLFPESAHKMFWQPLPYYYKGETWHEQEDMGNRYGYFGAYFPAARNLAPFYNAAKETGIEVNICGNPSNLFASTDNIHIHPRLPLDELKPIENHTNVLVFLCNRKGGQIPGKIYQYSATNKTILFIMDGTPDEQKVLKEFFGRFNRYIFCQNAKEDIVRAIRRIEAGDLGTVRNEPVEEFDPTITIHNILNAGS